MATTTLGTNDDGSLTALQFKPGYASGMATADVASINNGILDDLNNIHPIVGGDSFGYNGWLYVPNRGRLKLMAGDYVAIDSTTGWPILVSAHAIAAGPWTVGS